MKLPSIIIRDNLLSNWRLLPLPATHVFESQKDAIFELRNMARIHGCQIQGPFPCDKKPGRLYQVIDPETGDYEFFRVLATKYLKDRDDHDEN